MTHDADNKQQTPDQDVRRVCPSFEALSAYFDGALDPAASAMTAAHVAGCSACAGILNELRAIRQALVATSPALSTRSFELTEAMIAPHAPTTESPPSSIPLSLESRRTIPWLPFVTAIAALLLVVVITADVASRDNGSSVTPTPATNALVINGTVFPAEGGDLDDSFSAASQDSMNGGSTSAETDTGSSPQSGSDLAEDSSQSAWWLITEIGLAILLAMLVATLMFRLRRRKQLAL